MEPLQILVIDDEENILDVFRAVLEELGHTVFVASSGEEGLEVVSERSLDLVFLDIKLPKMTGTETLQNIRKSHSTLRIVMITGVLDDEIYDASIYSEHAANGFITKPCSFQSIEDCIQKVMGEDAAFLRTPRDELRYAFAKVRNALESSRATFAFAEATEGEPMTVSLVKSFGYDRSLSGTISVHGDRGLRALLRDDPEFTEEAGLHCERTCRLLAERAKQLFQCDWGVAALLTKNNIEPGAIGFIGVTGPEESRVIRKRFTATGEELARDAAHSLLVHLHQAVHRKS